MSNLADHPIGAVFPWKEDGEDEVMLEVVEDTGICESCHMHATCQDPFCEQTPLCTRSERSDCRSVCFILHNPKDTE